MQVERSLLLEGESPVREAGVAPAIYLFVWVMVGAILAATWFLFSLINIPWLTVIIAAIAIFYTAVQCAKAYSLGYMLTDRRLIVRWGLLRRDVSTAEIAALQDLHMHQSLPELLLNVGSLHVETAGTRRTLQLRQVSQPKEWADHIHQTAKAARAEDRPVWAPSPNDYLGA